MNNFLKVLIGLGAAAATAGIVISLAKKKEEPDFECDFEECGDDCECEGCCECENCDEEDCEDCDVCDDCEFCEEFEPTERPTAGDLLNSVVDGVMTGFVVAADKASELLTKAADYVSDKLDERKFGGIEDLEIDEEYEAYCECDCECDCEECADECTDECTCGCCEAVEEAVEVAEEVTDEAPIAE